LGRTYFLKLRGPILGYFLSEVKGPLSGAEKRPTTLYVSDMHSDLLTDHTAVKSAEGSRPSLKLYGADLWSNGSKRDKWGQGISKTAPEGEGRGGAFKAQETGGYRRRRARERKTGQGGGAEVRGRIGMA